MESLSGHRPTGKSAPLLITPQQRQLLQSLCRGRCRVTAERAQVILALAQGDNSSQVAQQRAMHPAAVRRIKRHFLKGGVEGLPARRPTGRPAHKRALVMQTLSELSVRHQLRCEQRGVLSAAAIATLVQQRHGVRVGVATVRGALKKGAFGIAERDTP